MRIKMADRLIDTVNIFLLLIFVIATFYPFYYMLIYSLSSPDVAVRGVYLLPRNFTFINYIRIFQESNLLKATVVSVLRTTIGTTLTLLCSSLFAYGISKKNLPMRKFMYRGLVMTMYFSVGIIPWYVTMVMYGMKNNFLLYILPGAVGAFYVVLLKTYFEQLPASIEESAMIDGAGYFRTFWQIVLPLCTPILATIVLYSAVSQWNSWFDNFMLCSSEKLRTLPFVLYIYLNSQSIKLDVNNLKDAATLVRVTPTSVRITITVIVAAPIFMVYPFVQKYFIKGLLVGAVKG